MVLSIDASYCESAVVCKTLNKRHVCIYGFCTLTPQKGLHDHFTVVVKDSFAICISYILYV